MAKTNNDSALKDDFLAAYHSILFSRTSKNDTDVERRRLAVKYMTARKFESEDTAAVLLDQGLKQYETLLEKTGSLGKIKFAENRDRIKWRSSLKEPKKIVSLIKPLPCQRISSDRVCGRRDIIDRDVENLMKIADEKDDCSMNRKLSTSQRDETTRKDHSRSGQDNLSRYDRCDDPRPGKSSGNAWDRTQESDTKKYEQSRSGFFKSENESSGRTVNRNMWERFDENSGKTYDRRSSIFNSENESSAGIQNRRNKWEEPIESSSVKYEKQRSERFGCANESLGRVQKRNRWERIEDGDCDRRYDQAPISGPFRTAKAELHIQQQQQQQKTVKKSLGGKASINSRFVCPLKRDKDRDDERTGENSTKDSAAEPEDERLRGIDEKLIELVRNEIMDSGTLVSWDDVAGLEHAKKIIKEIVVLPMLRPDIFTGLRRPPKGILLFGPPGTGKTLIGKCIASQSKSTFFSISASSLTSKWIGEGEKMVRALFAVARVHQPSVIFIDEIDSLLTQRSESEHESSRRIKTEFLVQLDGAATGEEDRILVIGATNRPQELDEAARRRFVKRLHVPLPEFEARRKIVDNLLAAIPHELDSRDIDNVAASTEHYSGADMTNLCKEASMGPIRSIPFDMLENIRKEEVRCVTANDFNEALNHVRPSVSQSDLGIYVNWDRMYGSGTASLGKIKIQD